MTETSDEVANREQHRIPVEPSKASLAERKALLKALFEKADREGWRSDGPYGPRDELYDR